MDCLFCKIINGDAAGENDFDTEFLDYILAVKVVDSTCAIEDIHNQILELVAL